MGFAQNIIAGCGAGLGRCESRTETGTKIGTQSGAKCGANAQAGLDEQGSSDNVAISHFVSSISTGKLS
jgi:hypothetical protein